MIAALPFVFARCLGFVLRAPGFSHPSVPHTARVGAAAAFSGAFVIGVRSGHDLDWSAATLVLLALELGFGAAIGVAASVLYDGAYAGGRALDDYLGIHAGVAAAPLAADSGLGRFCSNTALAGLLLGDGYARLLSVFDRGFQCFPPGHVPNAQAFAHFATTLPTYIFCAAGIIVGPAIIAVLLTQIALAAMSRVVPRFSSFTLTFPLTFALALLVVLPQAAGLLHYAAVPWFTLPACTAR